MCMGMVMGKGSTGSRDSECRAFFPSRQRRSCAAVCAVHLILCNSARTLRETASGRLLSVLLRLLAATTAVKLV
jgi:hypothetical protein